MHPGDDQAAGHSGDSLATSQWNAVPGLQTTPTVLNQNNSNMSAWSARPATPLAPPNVATTDWTSSETDWSSRSANARLASKPSTISLADSWGNPPSSAAPTTPAESSQVGGWGPPPSTPVANGWGATPAMASTTSVPTNTSNNWTAPSLPSNSARRPSFTNPSTEDFGSVQRRSSEHNLRSAPTSGWSSPSVTQNASSAVTGGNWGTVAGGSTTTVTGNNTNNWNSTGTSSTAQPSSGGWGSVPGASTVQSMQSQPSASGWGAVPGVSTNTIPQQPTSGWGASQPQPSSQSWGSVPGTSTPIPQQQNPSSGWDTVPGTSSTLMNKASTNSLKAAASGGWGTPTTNTTNGTSNWNSPRDLSSQSNNWGKETTPLPSAGGWNSVSGAITTSAREPTPQSQQSSGWNSVPGVSTNPTIQDARPSVGGWSSPSPVGSQSSGWGNNTISSQPSSGASWNNSATPSTSRKDPTMQGNGWSPSPAASPIATTGWNSPNSTSTAAVPTRPTKGSGGIGGWNPQGWNGGAAPANTQSKVATSSPRGPPPNDVGWGGGVTKGPVNLGGNEGDGETALGKAGVIGAGFRRAKSTMELNGRSAASPAGSSRAPDNNIVISEVGTPGTSMRLFAKSFADISVETRQQTSIVPVKDELATAIGIYVFGLPATFKIKEILSIFGEFGDVMNAGLTPASASNPRAYAHILYEEVGSAAKAIRATHGKNVTASSDPLEVVPDFGATVPASAVSVSSTPTPGVPASTMAKVPQQPHQSTNSASSNVDASLGVENRTVHIANVPLTVTKADVEKIFGRGAEIRFINIVPRPKEKRNMVFITFKNHAAASKALSIAKTGKHFGMTEALKVDFSKAETRAAVEQQKQNTGVASTSTVSPASSTMKDAAPVVTMKKKTEVAKPQEKKLSEKKSTTSLTASISSANGNSGKKTQRPSLYIRDVKSSETEASLSAALAQQAGPVSSCHIISRLDGGTRYALVTFEYGEDAAKAVRDKIENAVYPRQRRITLSHIPKDTSESQLMKVFQSCGEVKRVEFLAGSSDTDGYLTAELEFARGDGAILAHIMLVEGKIGGNLTGVRGGYSLPTSNTVSGSTEAEETAATATVASDTVTISDSIGNANDEISNQHDYSQYDIEGGDDVEVIRLSDLEE